MIIAFIPPAAAERQVEPYPLLVRLVWHLFTFVILALGLCGAVGFMLSALSLFDPSRVPS